MKKLIAMVLAMGILFLELSAMAAMVDRTMTPYPAFEEKTPAKNIFKIDGSNEEFILLDNTKDGYFVLTKGVYGSKPFDPDNTHKFDVEDTNNVAYYLNHAFKEEGYLPEEILANINEQKEWLTEAGTANGPCPTDFTQVFGIGLLSQTEWEKYAGSFGGKDDITGNGWWLRSPRGISGAKNIALMAYLPVLGTTMGWDAFAALPLRPCFYLNKDFFSKVKLQTEGLGSSVKKTVLAAASDEQLTAVGYTEKEIRDLKDNAIDLIEEFSFSHPDVTGNFYFKNELKFEVSMLISWRERKKYILRTEVDGVCKSEQTVMVTPNYKADIPIVLTDSPYGIHNLTIKIMDGERLAKEFNYTYAVITQTGEQFMDWYNHRGFAMHYGQENSSNSGDTALLKKLGITSIRDGVDWAKIERTKGALSEERSNQFIPELEKNDINLILTLLFNNNLYSGIDASKVPDSTKYGPKTKHEFDGFANYSAFLAKKYPHIRIFQIWNEPFGNGFWKPEKSPEDYTYMMQIAAHEIWKERPDAAISGGSLGASEIDFLKTMAANDGYSYFDSVSYHIYIYPQLADDRYEAATLGFVNKMNMELGGWKPLGVTETGWPTQLGERGVTVEQQAIETVKQYVHSAVQGLKYNTIYDFRNDGRDINNREHNFGVVDKDFNAKPAAISSKYLLEMTAGAVYIGSLHLNDTIELHGYLKNGELLLIAWTKGDNEILDLGDGLKNARYTDMYGNPLQYGARPVLGEEPMYIQNAEDALIFRIAENEIKRDMDAFSEFYQNNAAAELEFVKAQKEKLAALLAGGDAPKEADITAYLENFYRELSALPAKGSGGGDTALSSKMYMLHLMGESTANLLLWKGYRGAELPFRQDFYAAKDELLNQMQNDEKQVVGGKYRYANAMIKFAELYYINEAERAEKDALDSPMKQPFITVRGYLADKVLQIAEAFRTAEKPSSDDFLIQLPTSQRDFYNFAENTVEVSLYNYGAKDYAGKVVLEDSEGGVVFEAEAQMEAGKSGVLPVTFSLRNNTADGSKYVLKLYGSDGGLLKSAPITAKIQNRATMQLKEAETKLEQLNSITVKVNNTFNAGLKGTVQITPPDGWSLAETEQSFSVAEMKTAEVTFTVSGKSRKPFNQYAFDITVKDDKGDLLASGKQPLQFPIAVKARAPIETDAFQGNIDDWSDAYPVYLGAPDDPDSEEAWSQSNVAARVYTKWDEENLYVLYDVNDDAHHQGNNGGERIWDGDSIQISLDCGNDKTVGYDKNDYELGFAKAESGDVGYVWTNPDSTQTGVLKECYVKIIRDDNNKHTRYLVKLPQTFLSAMQLKSGNIFGVNYAVHDADLTTRERMFEVTEGTIYSKNPSKYYTWHLEN